MCGLAVDAKSEYTQVYHNGWQGDNDIPYGTVRIYRYVCRLKGKKYQDNSNNTLLETLTILSLIMMVRRLRVDMTLRGDG